MKKEFNKYSKVIVIASISTVFLSILISGSIGYFIGVGKTGTASNDKCPDINSIAGYNYGVSASKEEYIKYKEKFSITLEKSSLFGGGGNSEIWIALTEYPECKTFIYDIKSFYQDKYGDTDQSIYKDDFITYFPEEVVLVHGSMFNFIDEYKDIPNGPIFIVPIENELRIVYKDIDTPIQFSHIGDFIDNYEEITSLYFESLTYNGSNFTFLVNQEDPADWDSLEAYKKHMAECKYLIGYYEVDIHGEVIKKYSLDYDIYQID